MKQATQVRSIEFANALKVQLSLNATREALMQVQRAHFEKKNIVSLHRWLSEWRARDASYKLLQREISEDSGPSVIHPIDSVEYAELETALDSLNEASDAFLAAIDAKNHALLVRWMDEWKARRARWDQLAETWLEKNETCSDC